MNPIYQSFKSDGKDIEKLPSLGAAGVNIKEGLLNCKKVVVFLPPTEADFKTEDAPWEVCLDHAWKVCQDTQLDPGKVRSIVIDCFCSGFKGKYDEEVAKIVVLKMVAYLKENPGVHITFGGGKAEGVGQIYKRVIEEFSKSSTDGSRLHFIDKPLGEIHGDILITPLSKGAVGRDTDELFKFAKDNETKINSEKDHEDQIKLSIIKKENALNQNIRDHIDELEKQMPKKGGVLEYENLEKNLVLAKECLEKAKHSHKTSALQDSGISDSKFFSNITYIRTSLLKNLEEEIGKAELEVQRRKTSIVVINLSRVLENNINELERLTKEEGKSRGFEYEHLEIMRELCISNLKKSRHDNLSFKRTGVSKSGVLEKLWIDLEDKIDKVGVEIDRRKEAINMIKNGAQHFSSSLEKAIKQNDIQELEKLIDHAESFLNAQELNVKDLGTRAGKEVPLLLPPLRKKIEEAMKAESSINALIKPELENIDKITKAVQAQTKVIRDTIDKKDVKLLQAEIKKGMELFNRSDVEFTAIDKKLAEFNYPLDKAWEKPFADRVNLEEAISEAQGLLLQINKGKKEKVEAFKSEVRSGIKERENIETERKEFIESASKLIGDLTSHLSKIKTFLESEKIKSNSFGKQTKEVSKKIIEMDNKLKEYDKIINDYKKEVGKFFDNVNLKYDGIVKKEITDKGAEKIKLQSQLDELEKKLQSAKNQMKPLEGEITKAHEEVTKKESDLKDIIDQAEVQRNSFNEIENDAASKIRDAKVELLRLKEAIGKEISSSKVSSPDIKATIKQVEASLKDFEDTIINREKHIGNNERITKQTLNKFLIGKEKNLFGLKLDVLKEKEEINAHLEALNNAILSGKKLEGQISKAVADTGVKVGESRESTAGEELEEEEGYEESSKSSKVTTKVKTGDLEEVKAQKEKLKVLEDKIDTQRKQEGKALDERFKEMGLSPEKDKEPKP